MGVRARNDPGQIAWSPQVGPTAWSLLLVPSHRVELLLELRGPRDTGMGPGSADSHNRAGASSLAVLRWDADRFMVPRDRPLRCQQTLHEHHGPFTPSPSR